MSAQAIINNAAPTPSVHRSWRFGGLPAAELMPQLQKLLLKKHLLKNDPNANWQLVWLNNNGHPVIGFLPKTSWSVYYDVNNDVALNRQTATYKVVKHCRDTADHITTTQMSYDEWQDELIDYSKGYKHDCPIISDNQNNPSYHHGLIGFIGYDIAAYELSPASGIAQAEQPSAVLGHYDIYLSFNDHKADDYTLNIQNQGTEDAPAMALINQLITYLDQLDDKLSKSENTNTLTSAPTPLTLTAQWHKSAYQQAFYKTQRYLQQGDCYQINLTQAWQGDLSQSNNNSAPKIKYKLLEYLPNLHANTQAPFAGYLANVDFELLSCSPELFFTFTKDTNTGKHHIMTKPIKGTMPRGATVEQDDAYKQQLIDSEKDRAENVMIVDLLRNDLGKYAKIGSVKVPQLFAIESFSNVHHMVSTISAQLKEDTHPLIVLFDSLPAGSITGTPKKRAVEIINELEKAPRGAYCGTMGYMNFDGSGQWNVLIRTLQASHPADETTKISLWAGGGITVASDCDAEYQECLDKVGNLLTVLSQDNPRKQY